MTEHHHDDGLSPAARAALAALRAEDDLPPAVQRRMWSRLADAAAADARADMSQETGARPGRRGALIGLAIAAGLALTVLGLQHAARPVAVAPQGEAAAYGGASPSERAARPGAREGGASPRAPAATAGEAGDLVAPGDGAGAARPDTARPEASPRRRAATSEDPSAAREPVPRDMSDAPAGASPSALAAEAALLQAAQTALAAGDVVAALQQLERHAREFPGGVLAPERAALRVVALCAGGREKEGRAAAASFLRAHPGSVLAGRVRGACVTP